MVNRLEKPEYYLQLKENKQREIEELKKQLDITSDEKTRTELINQIGRKENILHQYDKYATQAQYEHMKETGNPDDKIADLERQRNEFQDTISKENSWGRLKEEEMETLRKQKEQRERKIRREEKKDEARRYGYPQRETHPFNIRQMEAENQKADERWAWYERLKQEENDRREREINENNEKKKAVAGANFYLGKPAPQNQQWSAQQQNKNSQPSRWQRAKSGAKDFGSKLKNRAKDFGSKLKNGTKAPDSGDAGNTGGGGGDYWSQKKDEQEAKKLKRENREATKEKLQKIGRHWGANLFIILALCLHFVKLGLGFNVIQTWILDVLFALLVYMVFFDNDDKGAKGIRAIVILLALEIALPFILNNVEFLAANKYIHYYLANRILTPWWFYFAVFWANSVDNPHWLSKSFKLVVVLFWIGVILGSLPAITFSKISPAEYMETQQSDLWKDFCERSKGFWVDAGGAVKDSLKNFADGIGKQMDVASGGYYTGMVDRNSDKDLGVYIERVQPTAPSFHYGSEVSVFGDVHVKSLTDSVLLNLSCYYGGKNSDGDFRESQRAPEVYPREAKRYYNLENEQVDCIFPNMPKGSQRVTVTAEFNFETMAYQKTYFMERSRMRALVGAGKDPLDEYGIDDKDPQAKYTNGPVMIGMDVSNQPTPVTDDYSSQTSLGITLESNTGWEGRIKQLNELVIQVPNATSLDMESCNKDFREASDAEEEVIEGYKKYRSTQFKDCQEELGLNDNQFDEDGEPEEKEEEDFNNCLSEAAERESEGYKTYYLEIDEENKRDFKNIDRYKTFSCRVNIDNEEKLLGGRPLSTEYFRAKARYDYEIDKETRVEVKKDRTEDVDPYPLPEKTEGEHLKINADYGDLIKESIDEIKDAFDEDFEHLTPCLIQAMIIQESEGDPHAENSNDPSFGLMQVKPGTKSDVVDALEEKGIIDDDEKLDLMEPKDNILIGTYYIAQQIKTSIERGANEDDIVEYALAQYNHGPGGTKKCLDQSDEYKGFDSCNELPSSTLEDYVPTITKSKEECEKAELDNHAELKEERELEFSDDSFEFEIKLPVRVMETNFGEIDKRLEPYKTFYELVLDDEKFEKERNRKKLLSCIRDGSSPEECKKDTDLDDVKLDDDYYEKNDKEEYDLTPLGKDYIELIENIDGRRDLKMQVKDREKEIEKKRLSINSHETMDPQDKRIVANLTFNDEIEIDEEDFTLGEDYEQFGEYPFVKAKLEDCEAQKDSIKCELKYKYANNFIQNTGEITNEAELDSLLQVKFNKKRDARNTIIIEDNNGDKICEFEWSNSFNEPKKCINEDSPQGMGIIIRDAFDNEVSEDIRNNKASVQIEYNPKEFESECCPDCEGFAQKTCS
ncbi:MAG: transglycosylase SLT domain-containing protein [Nanoarchaeota archaeon]